MAILSKIREKSWLLIVIIGMALFAFVASPEDILNFAGSSKSNSIGSVDGDYISREDFGAQVEAYKSNTGLSNSSLQAVNTVWNSMVSERLYADQLEKAGIIIGEKDIWDALVQIPGINQNPQFVNEAGFFDENKLRSYLADIKLDAEAGDEDAQRIWSGWLTTENNVKRNLEQAAYGFLVSQGVGASLEEGKFDYLKDNTKMNVKYVYLPFSSINDDEIEVSNSEIESYIKSHADQYQVEASRSVQIVRFPLQASEGDKEEIEKSLSSLKENREEYDSASKTNYTVKGMAESDDMELFFEENGSDLALEDQYYFENTFPIAASEQVFAAQEGDVVGPYEDRGYIKLTKVLDRRMLADTARASHILIPFLGSRGNNPVLTKEEAKAQADSIATVLRKSPSKMNALAEEFSADRTSNMNGGDLDWFGYSTMVPEFRDFVFLNSTGSVGVVETVFGYHVIRITGQKNKKQAVKVASFARQIVASTDTESQLFEDAENFNFQINEGQDFADLAKENGYSVIPANNLVALSENVPGIGQNRAVVRWAFEESTELGDVKRFDLMDGSYAVVRLTMKMEKGLMPASRAKVSVYPILVNEKKAEILKSRLKGGDLAAISKNINQPIQNLNEVTLGTPTIAGVGREVGVFGAMAGAPVDKLVNGVVGNRGVFAFVVQNRTIPQDLPNYETMRNSIIAKYQSRYTQVDQALIDKADIVDNRADFY